MKIKWLYKIPLVTAATAIVAPMIVSCSVEKPKVETAEEKEKRLEHQRSVELAPNLTKFMKEYNNKLDRGNAEYVVRNIKELKEHTSNINNLNDFEKSYLGLYEDIQNFFNNSIHKYTKDNISFDYFNEGDSNKDTKLFSSYLKLEETTLTQEQVFYNKIYQVIKQYTGTSLEGTTSKYIEGKEVLITEVLDKELTPIINEKIAEFAGNHKDFQFKNSKLTFKETEKGIQIEVSLEVEYQNQKLPQEIIIPLTFNLKPVQLVYLETEKKLVKIFEKRANKKEVRKNVKTFAEIENILKSEDNNYNRDQLKEIKKQYDYTLKVLEEDENIEM